MDLDPGPGHPARGSVRDFDLCVPRGEPGGIVFGSALVVSLLTTPAIRAIALRWELGDKPNGRKLNDSQITHLGGIALFLAILVALVSFFSLTSPTRDATTLVLRAIPVVLLIVGLGIIDDTRN